MDQKIKNLIKEITETLVVVEKHTGSKKEFTLLFDKYYDLIKQGFEIKEFRTALVPFKFFDKEDQYIHTLELRHFVTNLILWKGLVVLERYSDITPDHIMDCTKLSSRGIKNYMDTFIIIPYRKEFSNKKMNNISHDIIHNLGRISTDFNIILGLSINVETFINVAKANTRFNEIIRTKIDENMQPNEIEATIDSLMDEQIEILKQEENFLQPILKSGTGIKSKQLAEFAINGGLKPDLDGNTIPIPINSNFIVGGLSNVTNYFIDSIGGRKALIMAKSVMGKSGHFARMIMLLATDVRLSKTLDNCGTIRPIEVVIRTKAYLKRFVGRNYRLPHVGKYRILKETDTHLIGQTILVRSPVTCASKKVCKMCYGELYHTNKNIKSAGGLAGTKITRPLSQNILSAKHLLTTQSDKLEFNDEFHLFFVNNSNEIMLNPDTDDTNDIDINNYQIVIDKEEIKTIDQFEESDFNMYVSSFKVRHKKTGEEFTMAEQNGSELYIYPELKEYMDASMRGDREKDLYEIDLSKISFDDRLFGMEITNRELTRPMYSIINLLNRSDHEGCETIDEMIQKLLDLMIESGIKADSVHGEMIIRPLIRSDKDILEFPRFNRYDEREDYRILTVDSALQNHPSVTISLAYQNLGRQLIRPITYRKRGTSFVDPFFKERL